MFWGNGIQSCIEGIALVPGKVTFKCMCDLSIRIDLLNHFQLIFIIILLFFTTNDKVILIISLNIIILQ